MNKVITIGRQYGSGGREIGQKLAKYYFSLQEYTELKESCVSEKEVLVTSKLIVRQSTKVNV